MSNLTDRYVWAVLRSVPGDQRADLEPEIRALVADAVDARGGAEPADATERAALSELGDPDALAARYIGRPRYLIGPELYPTWRRLVTLLLPIVVPIGIAATVGAAWAAGRPASELVGVGITAGVNVALQLLFWFTLVFAVLERAGHAPFGEHWSLDRLPELPRPSAPSVAEVAVSVTGVAIGVLALAWQQTARPITIDGQSYPLLDGALWSSWIPWLLVVVALQCGLTLVRWARGGWTVPLAVANLALSLAFLLPVLKLGQDGRLFDPGLVAALDRHGVTTSLHPAAIVIAVVAVAGASWDVANGFRQARREGGRTADLRAD